MARRMKDSGIEWIGEIPKDWEVVPNKYLMEKCKVLISKYNNESILSLTKSGVIVRDLEAGGKMPNSFDGYQKLENGNLLLCLFDYDVTPRTVGRIVVDGITSPAYSQYKMKKIANRDYYYYYYLLLDFTKELLHLSKNLRSSFSEFEFGQIKAVSPSVQEQKKIANFLDHKTEKISEIKSTITKQIESLEEYKKSVITEVVTKGLDKNAKMKDSGIEWIGEIPEDWEVSKLKWHSVIKSGIFLDKNEFTDDGKIDVFGANAKIGNYVKANIHKKTILTGRVGTIGTIKIKENVWITDNVLAISTDDNILEYIYYYLNIVNFNDLSNSTAQPLITASKLGNISLPIPEIQEQQQIVSFLDKKTKAIDDTISAKKKQLEALEEYKKSLIYEYVTGKKEVFDED